MTQKLKTALLLTGAAARISQEVALLDQLRAQKGLSISQNDTLIAGFSSGSLNLAAINACFSTGSTLDWDKYYKQTVLFPLKNSDVYVIDGIPLDTTPLRNTIQKFNDTMNCKNVGNLPFHSYILTFSWRRFIEKLEPTLWACSRVDGQKYINLTDMFMSSTAIPVVFPWQEIHCETGQTMDFPKGHFADGGTHGTFDNFDEYLGEYVRENGAFENMFIISPMREKSEQAHEEIVNIVKSKASNMDDISKFIDHLKHISMNGFLDFLQKLNAWRYNGSAMAKNIYISIPEMASNYPIINFDLEEQQYNAVTDWIKQNPGKLAIPIDQFLQTHHKE